ncbi:MAG: tyrosine-type recombinase/integrase [Myxococcales bacterium]|nr:tyrosine-type recombinase/integrase [Myxococcales bacterium]
MPAPACLAQTEVSAKGSSGSTPARCWPCSTAPVPLRWRKLYALATYLYVRPGELAALEWADVHLDHGYVYVHQSLDLRTGETKSTKTKLTRKVPVPEALRPLLESMHRAAGGKGRVIQNQHANKDAEHGFPPLEDLADRLRVHLKRAGVDRADLYADRPTTKRITFYDLRATGITWEVLAGTEHVRVMQRAGHVQFSTTLGYIREAETLGLAVGTPFPPLPPSVVDAETGLNRPSQSSQKSARGSAARNHTRSLASPTGFEPVLQP